MFLLSWLNSIPTVGEQTEPKKWTLDSVWNLYMLTHWSLFYEVCLHIDSSLSVQSPRSSLISLCNLTQFSFFESSGYFSNNINIDPVVIIIIIDLLIIN